MGVREAVPLLSHLACERRHSGLEVSNFGGIFSHDALNLDELGPGHDMSEALLMADRVAVMRGGRIVALGTPRELLADPGDDYAREILAAPRRNAKRLAELEAPAEPEG